MRSALIPALIYTLEESCSLKEPTQYWICTEQSKTDNRFHLYDRQTLERISTMYLEDVSYTDGITTAYMHGNWYLYAVDNDKRVVAFQLPEIN